MKKIIICILIIAVIISLLCVLIDKKDNNEEVLRLHIRANSNSETDQKVKLEVRDELVEFIQSKIYEAEDKAQVQKIIEKNKKEILAICDSVLEENNFNYKSNMKVTNEFFPTRSYGDISFESGYYDSVIIELGSGKGDNWWCALYPPICFVGNENETDNFVYKSKIAQMISNFKKNKK